MKYWIVIGQRPRDDDVGIIVIQYEHDETKEAWGCLNPHWMTEDKYWEFVASEENDTYDVEDYDHNCCESTTCMKCHGE